MHEVNDRSRDIGEFVPAPDDDMLICRCEEITKGEIRKAVHEGMWTMTEIRRYLRDNSNLRISRSIKDLAYKILKVKEEYFMDNGKELSNSEVAKRLGCDEIDVIIALDAMRDPISMFEPIYNDGGDTIYLEDQLESKKDKISNWDITISLKNAINELKDKERKIITERFLIGKTQMEIAEEIGISQAQVSRLEKCGIEDLRKMIM